MTTEQLALVAARARTCQALMCTARFCILTPSLGMSSVSLGVVLAPKPPGKHQAPWELTHILPAPCQRPVSSPAARQALSGCGPVSWQKNILHPGKPGAPQPLPRVLNFATIS